MNKWRPVDLMVMLMVISIFVFMMGVLYRAVFTEVLMSEAKAKITATFVASIISIVSMYVGAAIQRNLDGK